MKLLTGLFMAAKRRLMTTDSNSDSFKSKLDELIEKKDSLSAEDIGTRVDELKKLADELPEATENHSFYAILKIFERSKAKMLLLLRKPLVRLPNSLKNCIAKHCRMRPRLKRMLTVRRVKTRLKRTLRRAMQMMILQKKS